MTISQTLTDNIELVTFNIDPITNSCYSYIFDHKRYLFIQTRNHQKKTHPIGHIQQIQ